MMNYNDAKSAIHTTAIRPDGYNGHFANIGFAYETTTGITWEVADCGVYHAGLPLTNSLMESKQVVREYESKRPYILNKNTLGRQSKNNELREKIV